MREKLFPLETSINYLSNGFQIDPTLLYINQSEGIFKDSVISYCPECINWCIEKQIIYHFTELDHVLSALIFLSIFLFLYASEKETVDLFVVKHKLFWVFNIVYRIIFCIILFISVCFLMRYRFGLA